MASNFMNTIGVTSVTLVLSDMRGAVRHFLPVYVRANHMLPTDFVVVWAYLPTPCGLHCGDARPLCTSCTKTKSLP